MFCPDEARFARKDNIVHGGAATTTAQNSAAAAHDKNLPPPQICARDEESTSFACSNDKESLFVSMHTWPYY
jgi:hypothetical protein